MIQVRQLQTDDLPGILDVQRAAYRAELLENGDTFVRIMKLFPRGCLGAFENQQHLAYVFSHPWRSDAVVPLDDPRTTIPADVDCLYIHDLAVKKSSHHRGLATQLLLSLFKIAEELGFSRFGLVAVQESEQFWKRWGFRREETLLYTDNVPATHMVLERGA